MIHECCSPHRYPSSLYSENSGPGPDKGVKPTQPTSFAGTSPCSGPNGARPREPGRKEIWV